MRFILRAIGVSLCLLIFSTAGLAQPYAPVFTAQSTPWADSVFSTLSLDQKIGQLFMVAAWSDPANANFNGSKVEEWIEEFGIGGICFFQGGPAQQVYFTNRYQSLSRIPLLIAMDAEWGLSMRLDSTILYPRQMTLGAMQEEAVVEEFGLETARQLKRLGVHFSFSPVVDINNNPNNPVISNRSFGEDREKVTRFSLAYMRGLQHGGVLACAKHFPGHGDTSEDSHEEMPVIPFSQSRLDSLELYPYPPMIQQGLASVMVGHLSVPAWEPDSTLPATLSPRIVSKLLKDKMGFQGLVVTDALNMQGVAKHFPGGKMEALAFQAGNDILLYPSDIPKAIEEIKELLAQGTIQMDQINASCLKVLRAKEWAGANRISQISPKHVIHDLNSLEAIELNQAIVDQSVVCLSHSPQRSHDLLNHRMKKAVLVWGGSAHSAFVETLRASTEFDLILLDKSLSEEEAVRALDTLNHYQASVVTVLGTSNRANKFFGMSQRWMQQLPRLSCSPSVHFVLFANPFALAPLDSLDRLASLWVGFQDDPLTQHRLAEMLLGARSTQGRLPVTINAKWKVGFGLDVKSIGVLGEDVNASRSSQGWIRSKNASLQMSPLYKENMMIDGQGGSTVLEEPEWSQVDSIAQDGLNKGAYPGCRVMVAYRGQIIHDASFGYTSQDKSVPVSDSTVYDLASITKLAASSLAAMWLVDHHLLDVEKELGEYLTFPKGSDYAKIKIKDMFAHQSGLKDYIPFYLHVDQKWFSDSLTVQYHWKVADGMYVDSTVYSYMRSEILAAPLEKHSPYRYSDLGYYFLREILEKQTGRGWEAFLQEEFYTPMHLTQLGYRPLTRTPLKQIAPTEQDQTFRKQLIHGYVHDQGAALMGGVAGHAGLFSNAHDLTALLQMLLNQGSYGGVQFITPQTVQLFNTRPFANNRRGLIFDKPTLDHQGGSASPLASDSSFGHTGFTGTMCWVDPEQELIYVFLSNRVHPNAENPLLVRLNVRTKIHTAIYQKIAEMEKNKRNLATENK